MDKKMTKLWVMLSCAAIRSSVYGVTGSQPRRVVGCGGFAHVNVIKIIIFIITTAFLKQ